MLNLMESVKRAEWTKNEHFGWLGRAEEAVRAVREKCVKLFVIPFE